MSHKDTEKQHRLENDVMDLPMPPMAFCHWLQFEFGIEKDVAVEISGRYTQEVARAVEEGDSR